MSSGETNEPEFDIETKFVSKDPEWRVRYTEYGPEGARHLDVGIFVDELEVGDLTHWSAPPELIDPEARERILDRLAARFLVPGTGVRHIVAGWGSPPLRLPGAYRVEVQFQKAEPEVVYTEPGRMVVAPGRALTGDRHRVLLSLEAIARWEPSGDPLTPAERELVLSRLAAHGDTAIELDDPASPRDAWQLAYELRGWNRVFAGALPRAVQIAEALDRAAPVPSLLFWMVELPTLYVPGKTGWNLDGPRFALAPIREEGISQVYDWLFGDELPVAPVFNRATDPNAERRMLLWSWSSARKLGMEVPPAVAREVVGVVIERGDPRGASALAAYVDGRIRFVGPHTVISCEPGLLPPLPALNLQLSGELTVRDTAPLAEGELRVTALTCGGCYVMRGPFDAGVRDVCQQILRALIEWTLPLGQKK